MRNMDRFAFRRAIERLRDGLFDPVAVNCLTVAEEAVNKSFSLGLKSLTEGQADHLCICGSYGQGKSHTLAHLHQKAISEGFATSFVQLDLREIPFHQFSVVYESLMEKLSLPDGITFAEAWRKYGDRKFLESLEMPYRFRMLLTGMISSPQKELLGNTQAKEFSSSLVRALKGNNLPLTYIKNILKNQGVEEYQKESLTCRGNLPYFQMVQSLGKLLKQMGYKGLVLFFDEAESITQGRVNSRAKSYEILQQFFRTKGSVYPVFAFTDDFFDKVNHEQYHDTQEKQTFSQNYAEAWKDLQIVRLKNFSAEGWEVLKNRLVQLYADAYQICVPNQIEIKEKLQTLLDNHKAQETRFKLKALVNQLDIETQHSLLDA